MVLEAVMVCVDNSDYSRNADFNPSRLDAQRDTANLIGGVKVQSNPENAVGLLTMAGKSVTVETAPTSDMGAFLRASQDIERDGESDFYKGIQTAQLALKHRVNRNQRQRIILFVGSPVRATEQQLEQAGKSLKKNNVALDIISFGEVQENSRLLKRLWLSVNSNDSSHLYEETEEGANLSSNVMLSPILAGETGGAYGLPGTGPDGMLTFGDPSTDPDLDMAIRLSLQDQGSRPQPQAQSLDATARGPSPMVGLPQIGGNVEGPTAGLLSADAPPAVEGASGVSSSVGPTAEEIENMPGIDDELRQALLLSLRESIRQPENDDADSEQKPGGLVVDEDLTMKKRILSKSSREINSEGQPPQKRIKDDLDESSQEFNVVPPPVPLARNLIVPGSSSATSSAVNGELLSHLRNSMPEVDFDNEDVQAALRNVRLPTSQDKKDGDDSNAAKDPSTGGNDN